MAALDPEQFTLISTAPPKPAISLFDDYSAHSAATRKATPVTLTTSIHARHPNLTLTITQTDVLGYSKAGHARAIRDSRDGEIIVRSYNPPAKRLGGEEGTLGGQIIFAKYSYIWKAHSFIIYIAEGITDGHQPAQYYYILCEPLGAETVTSESQIADELIRVVGKWSAEVHEEIWVYDQYWQKSRSLWEQVQKAEWGDVILDEEMKKAIRGDVERFFEERETYKGLSVPWKVRFLFFLL
jgi:transitional endoplasmic reticulum ATPase